MLARRPRGGPSDRVESDLVLRERRRLTLRPRSAKTPGAPEILRRRCRRRTWNWCAAPLKPSTDATSTRCLHSRTRRSSSNPGSPPWKGLSRPPRGAPMVEGRVRRAPRLRGRGGGGPRLRGCHAGAASRSRPWGRERRSAGRSLLERHPVAQWPEHLVAQLHDGRRSPRSRRAAGVAALLVCARNSTPAFTRKQKFVVLVRSHNRESAVARPADSDPDR